MNGRKSIDTFTRKAIHVEEALRLVLDSIRVMSTEEVPLMHSIGRTLAVELRAPQPIPHFRRSGMDGFAVRSADTHEASVRNPVELHVIDNVPAGKVSSKTLGPNECIRIMTGASVPDGADAVIKYEKTEEELLDDGTFLCKVKGSVRPGENVTPIGEELQVNEIVLSAGKRVGTGEIALLAMLGMSKVSVYKQPRVAILSTGAELLGIEEPLQPGRIRNSNTYMLAGAVSEYGGIPYVLDHTPDDVEMAKRIIHEAALEYDVVVTTGGVSVGDHDILYDLTRDWDGDLKFNKVLMRPGSPTTFGVWHGTPVFALSGNPSACYVGSHLFLRPALKAMMGGPMSEEPRLSATLTEDYLKSDRCTRYVRGIVTEQDGKLSAAPVGYDKSSATISLRDANCLICLPGSPVGYKAGAQVDVILIKEFHS